jgi:hypothetical protein
VCLVAPPPPSTLSMQQHGPRVCCPLPYVHRNSNQGHDAAVLWWPVRVAKPPPTFINFSALHCCAGCRSNPVALMGPLQTLGLMPHLMTLSLSLPRLEGLEMEALAALTGLSRLELAAPGGGAVVRTPVHLPHPWQWSQLVGLKALSLNSFVPGEAGPCLGWGDASRCASGHCWREGPAVAHC